MSIEQRRAPRFDVDLPAFVQRGEDRVQGRILNLSLGGGLVVAELDPPANIGDRVVLTFFLPTLDAPFELQTDVRWRAEHDAATLGLQFATGLRAKQTWAIGRFFEELAADEAPE